MSTRRVLVTGSSRGIGRAIALELADAGLAVTLHCLGQLDAARSVAQEIETRHALAAGSVGILQFDVRARESARSVLLADVQSHGAWWGVVCNAGITRDNTFAAMEGADWDDVLSTSLDGFYNVVQPLVMPMVRLRDGGRIVTLASVSGVMGNRGQVNYSAAKAGLIGATKALAVELASRRITVNCVAPGLVETDMTQSLDGPALDEALKMVPMGRAAQPQEVASVVAFLMSAGAGYVTRQVIGVNGGMV